VAGEVKKASRIPEDSERLQSALQIYLKNSGCMAYRKRNLLLKIIKIQDIVLEYKHKGASQRWIYNNIIRDAYYISEYTFNKYLARNAKRELEEMNKD
jgi:hypothetical protein